MPRTHRRRRRRASRYNRRTSRRRLIRPWKCRYGGATPPETLPPEIQQIQAERVAQQQQQQSSASPLQETANLAKGLAANFIENVGAKLGVNVTNPAAVNGELTRINAALTDPNNVAKLKQTVANAAQTGKEVLAAADPFIAPLVDKTIEEASRASSKIGEAAVKIGLNTAEEIPGVGVVIGTVRSLSNAGEAITAATNAASEITTAASDTANATARNWERLQAEKSAAMQRANASMQGFNAPQRIPAATT